MRDWESCLARDVQERSPNPEEARSLLRMAQIRQDDNARRNRTAETVPLIVESYWEIMKQLSTALLNLHGYKSYSQECLITFLEEQYDISRGECELMDQLRRLRNDIDYRGAFLDASYLDRNESRIQEIIADLEEHVEEELEG